jgi:hypothetical protein
MFKNGVECISKVLVAQDVVQLPEHQSAKSFNGETSSLPDKSDITAHTAEVLQLVERAQVPKGGWVGGDSWFGLCSFQQWKCISALEYTPVGLSSKTKAGFLKRHY